MIANWPEAQGLSREIFAVNPDDIEIRSAVILQGTKHRVRRASLSIAESTDWASPNLQDIVGSRISR